MAKTKTIPIDTLRQLLDYNPETGELLWKYRPIEMFKSTGRNTQLNNYKTFNARFANKPAFTAPLKGRYLAGRILGKHFLAHRIIWAIHYGRWPDEVDHEDHNGFNNKISNLKSASHVQNSRNKSLQFNNTTGTPGVHWSEARGDWRVFIGNKGKNVHLGYFKTIEEAISVRKAAELTLGYHGNHGS